MTNSLPWYRWPIEIDGLPFFKMGGSFHGFIRSIKVGMSRFEQRASIQWEVQEPKIEVR